MRLLGGAAMVPVQRRPQGVSTLGGHHFPNTLSEVHVLDGLEVINVRELLVERLPPGQKLKKRGSRYRFDDQPISFHAEIGYHVREILP